jgi:hypothetical protein
MGASESHVCAVEGRPVHYSGHPGRRLDLERRCVQSLRSGLKTRYACIGEEQWCATSNEQSGVRPNSERVSLGGDLRLLAFAFRILPQQGDRRFSSRASPSLAPLLWQVGRRAPQQEVDASTVRPPTLALFIERTSMRIDTFVGWKRAFEEVATYEGVHVPEPELRIARLCELWSQQPDPSWPREKEDQRLLKGRYLRGNPERPRGESELEHAILENSFDDIDFLGERLVDGVNAVPLSQDDRLEADMLLLARSPIGALRQVLVEVKVANKNAWYAVVENLRQLRLFTASQRAQTIFHRRGLVPDLPSSIPASGVILAPLRYFTDPGQKESAVGPARRLIQAIGVRIELAVWEDGPTPRVQRLSDR